MNKKRTQATIALPKSIVDNIEYFVSGGFFSNRSQFIRDAIHDKIASLFDDLNAREAILDGV